MQKSREYQTLLYACTQEGCHLCRLTQESVARYLDTWKYELFTDVDVRKELQRTQGFCNQHTWQLVHMGATLQLAQAYRDIITDLSEQLQKEPGTDTSTSRGLFLRLFENNSRREPEQCPACRRKEEARSATSILYVKLSSIQIFIASLKYLMGSACTTFISVASLKYLTRLTIGFRCYERLN